MTYRDPDKEPDGPRVVTYGGVKVESRYGKRVEMETMMAVLDQVLGAVPVESIFCDSKASCDYSLEVASPRALDFTLDLVAAALRDVAGGYNGITVRCGSKSAYADPWWNEP